MKRLCWLLLLLPLALFGQGARYENHPAMKSRADGALVATSATIAVLTQPANTTTQPGSPLATLYTDATLATPCTGTLKDGTVAGATNCSNPLVTDSKGNYHFYAATNVPYTIQVYGSGLTTSVEPDIDVPCNGANCTLGTTTVTGLTATSLTVSGALTAASVDGTVYCSTTLNAAAAAVSNPGAIIIPLGSSCPVTSNLTVPIGIDLIFQSGSSVNIATATTLTINGTITANLYDNIFSFTGTGSVVLGKLAATRAGVMWWGAKCDSSTNDHAALQAAMTALIRGGTLIFPSAGGQCLDASNGTIALNINNTVFLTLMGDSESGMGPSASGTRGALTFTGAPSTAGLSAQNAIGLTIKNLAVNYTSASFTSTVIDATNATSFRCENCELTGNGVSNATNLVLLAGAGVANFAQFHNCTFGEAVNGINAGNYLILSVDHCDFGSSGDVITGTYILGAGAGSSITNNKFELINAPNTSVVWDTSAVGCQGCIFQGNWIGDMPAGYTGTILKGPVGALIGNNFQGVTGATLLQDNGTQDQLVVIGNRFQSAWGTVFSCNGPLTDVDVAGNQLKFATITTFNGGAGPCFTSATTGRVVDNLGVQTVFGFLPTDQMNVALTADWTCGTGGTVASCVAATIIGSGGGVPLTFTLPLEARSWTIDCNLVVGQATGATANQWNLLTATTGATNVTANYVMGTAATAMAVGAVTDQASTTTTFQIAPSWTLGGTGTKMPAHIWARVEGAAAAGTVLSLQLVAPTVGDLVTIYRGSGCRLF